MSEPMTSGEIEDVLSSIRKLVSEDLRPQPRAAQAQAADAGKLILTPALRVVEGATEAEATLAATAPAPNQHAEPEPTRRLRLDTVVATFAAQVNPPADGWEAETGDATVTRLVRPQPARDTDDRVEPFPDVAAEDDTGTAQDMADSGVVPFGGRLHFAADVGADGHPDGDEPQPAAEVLQGHDEGSEAPMLDLDSDALADLVRDILREELQGALGERMTRNIRKLVRAEVARMMATRDLA